MDTKTKERIRLKADAGLAVLLASEEVLKAPSPSLGVAKFFRARGIRGERDDARTCPTAQYLRECVEDAYGINPVVFNETISFCRNEAVVKVVSMPTPAAVREFERDMGAGVYPDLDTSVRRDPFAEDSDNHYIVEPTESQGREYTVWRVNCIGQRWFIASYTGADTAVRLCSVMNQFAHTEVV